MPDPKRVMTMIVGVTVVALLVGILLPIAIQGLADPSETTYNQSVGETVELHADGLNTTLDSVTDGVDATYTVQYDGDSVTTTVNVDANQTVTVGGADVTIAPTEVGTDYAVTDYEYPTTLGWGSAGTLWDILPVVILLGPVLFMLFVGLRMYR